MVSLFSACRVSQSLQFTAGLISNFSFILVSHLFKAKGPFITNIQSFYLILNYTNTIISSFLNYNIIFLIFSL